MAHYAKVYELSEKRNTTANVIQFVKVNVIYTDLSTGLRVQ